LGAVRFDVSDLGRRFGALRCNPRAEPANAVSEVSPEVPRPRLHDAVISPPAYAAFAFFVTFVRKAWVVRRDWPGVFRLALVAFLSRCLPPPVRLRRVVLFCFCFMDTVGSRTK
jgi:hypothetical protein